MSRIENLRIVKHIKNNGVTYGIYECDLDGNKQVFVRNGMEIGIVAFMPCLSVEKCILQTSESIATEIANEVEFQLMVKESGE